MIASLLVLTGIAMSAVSCRKESINRSGSFLKAEVKTEYSLEKNDPDEEPYIRVRVKKKNSFTPVNNANVETFAYGTNVRFSSYFTDSAGEVRQTVPIGTYYFHITLPGTSIPYVTDTIHVNKDVTANVFVD